MCIDVNSFSDIASFPSSLVAEIRIPYFTVGFRHLETKFPADEEELQIIYF